MQIKDIDYGSAKSSTKNDQLNPVYGETFTFTIPTLDNMVLTCTVKDEDLGSRDDKLGKCKINLEKLGLTSSPMDVEKVVDRNIISANGKLFLKLSFQA